MRWRVGWSRGWAIGVFAAALIVGVLYSRAVRRVALGSEFQYIPRESVLLVATGDLRSLWTQVEGVMRSFSSSDGGSGEFADFLREMTQELGQADPPVAKIEDLERYGIDIDRGILISFYRTKLTPGFVGVVPVEAPEALLHALGDGMQPKKSFIEDPTRGVRHHVYDFGDFRISFPDARTAVVSDSPELLRRSLVLRTENMRHASNNDDLYHAIGRVARGPLLVGSNIFAYWQSRTAPFGERAAMLRLTPEEIRIDGEVELVGSTLRVVDHLRRRSHAGPVAWSRALPEGMLGFAVLQDDALSQYRGFVSEELLGEWLPEVAADLEELVPGGELPRVERVAFAVTDYEDGLPDFLAGFWGSRAVLEATLSEIQRQSRQSRDLPLLLAALAEYRSSGGPPPSLAELERERLLVSEEHSLFHRYPIELGGVGEPRFEERDFSTPAYEREIHGHLVRFLAPPLTRNDLRYRTDLAELGGEVLASDRYRMATVFLDDALWVATDVRDLESLLAPGDSDDGQRGGGGLRAVPQGAKVRLALDLERITTLGLLSPGSDLERAVLEGLTFLEAFSLFELDAVPHPDEQRMQVTIRLHRGSVR